MDTEWLMRIFLPVYLTALLLISYTLNVTSFKKKYGFDPRVTQPSDPVLYLCQQYRDGIFISIIFMVAVYSFFPSLYYIFVPFSFLDHEILKVSGAAVMLIAFVITRSAQYQLGRSWRIGIDRSGVKETLIVTGLYRWSRNPIALGLLLVCVGLFMVLPNAITFATILLVKLILQIRILIEEQHMLETYGVDYESYMTKTPRWLVHWS